MSFRDKTVLICLLLCLFVNPAARARDLELQIHYINVGWGSSVLVRGPDGTTVLLEAGNDGKGTAAVVPYLKSIGIDPASGLDYTIAGHQHCDHIGGLDEVVAAGYDVHFKNYYNGSSTTSRCVTDWHSAAATTTAGAPVVAEVQSQIPLGDGAKLTFVAVSGKIIGGQTVAVSDENDRSIAVLIQYGGFDYLWASDLGGGTIDQSCTGRYTSTQTDVESAVVAAISPGGAAPLISAGGIDLLHVNHHGSESSTNKNWMNYAKPAVAVIATGAGQAPGWGLPRINVVEKVLLARASACISAAPAFVLQTETGSPSGDETSTAGYSVGNITITTDGTTGFTVSADGQVTQGPNQAKIAGLPRTFDLDDTTTQDTMAPAVSISAPASGSSIFGPVAVLASATDNVGVGKVEFYLDGMLKSTANAAPYRWEWDTRAAGNGQHTLTAKAYDAAGNFGSSNQVAVAVQNSPGTDISRWKLTQFNATYEYIIPGGTSIPSKGYLIIARHASKEAFQNFWNVTLGPETVYINSAGAMPIINGGESYSLQSANGSSIDARTISMTPSAGKSIQRKSPCKAPEQSGSWSVLPPSAGTPGSGAGAGCRKGVVISEFTDPGGTGNYAYEFIELYNDK